MKAIVHLDRVIGFADGVAAGPDVPRSLEDKPAGRLFVVNGAVTDGAVRDSFYVDGSGAKHVTQHDPDWPLVNCKWDDALVRSDGIWTVTDNAEARRMAMRAAGGPF